MINIDELLKRFRKVCIDYYTLKNVPLIASTYECMSDDQLIILALYCSMIDFKEEIRKDFPNYEEAI